MDNKKFALRAFDCAGSESDIVLASIDLSPEFAEKLISLCEQAEETSRRHRAEAYVELYDATLCWHEWFEGKEEALKVEFEKVVDEEVSEMSDALGRALPDSELIEVAFAVANKEGVFWEGRGEGVSVETVLLTLPVIKRIAKRKR